VGGSRSCLVKECGRRLREKKGGEVFPKKKSQKSSNEKRPIQNWLNSTEKGGPKIHLG